MSQNVLKCLNFYFQSCEMRLFEWFSNTKEDWVKIDVSWFPDENDRHLVMWYTMMSLGEPEGKTTKKLPKQLERETF